jgi:hypothetical protein
MCGGAQSVQMKNTLDRTANRDDEAVTLDRRRPGRSMADEALVPLLRDPIGDGLLPDGLRIGGPPRQDDGRGFARGILFAVLLAIPLWLAIGGALYLLL